MNIAKGLITKNAKQWVPDGKEYGKDEDHGKD
jgi:hypothetical protein